MSSDLTPLAVLFLTFSLLAGLATASQAALHHINRARLRHLVEEGASRYGAIQRVLEEPNSLNSSIALLSTLAIGGATLAGALICWRLWLLSPALAVLGAVAQFFLVLAVQVTLRTLAMHYPEGWALRLSRPVTIVARLFWPVLAPLLALERALLRVFGVEHISDAPAAAEDELRLLVEEQNGVLEEDEREMMQGILGMGGRTVREVLVPRLDVTALPSSSTVRDAAALALDTGYSRLPVFDGSLDNVVGVLVAKDLLSALSMGNPEAPIQPLLRAAHFVPETKKIDELLRELQERRVHMAIVVDEYGGTAGLVTLEDLVEEIVGEIQDEYDTEEEALFERLSETEAIFDARASIHDVNEILELHLEDTEFDTLGGLVYDRLGKVPVAGDEVRVNGCTLSVLSTHGRRVVKVRVRVGVVADAPVVEA